MLKTLSAHLGRTVKFGRLRPTLPHHRAKLVDRITLELASPPTADFEKPAATILSDIMGNDAEGDCVPAGFNHVLGVETSNAGDPFHATLTQVNADYSAIGGYVFGDPSTDNGCDENTADTYYRTHGFANGTKSLGSVQLDVSNQGVVQAGIYLFENAIFGVELPDEWVNPFPASDGFVWDVAGEPNPEQGHCFIAVGYTAQGIIIVTWGMVGIITWAAVKKYCAPSANGQLFSIVTPDQLAKGQAKAPNGVAWADILADFDAMGGNPSVPVPKPPAPPVPPKPVPPPAPPAPHPAPTPPAAPTLTLAQAQAILAAGWPKH